MDGFDKDGNNENNVSGSNGKQYYVNGEFVPATGNGQDAENPNAAQASSESSTTEPLKAAEIKQEGSYTYQAPPAGSYENNRKPKRGMPGWAKALIVVAVVVLCIVLLTTSCNKAIDKVTDSFVSSDESSTTVTTNYGHDYIGVLDIVGSISEDGSDTYNHVYILNAIEAMEKDSQNKGIILYLDTPGGTVFASDEVYLKLKEYQEKTERPVYASMQSMAASGGYYISANADKIFANRNTWTGSIGVTLGTIYDVSELLDALGIKTNTITSGENKAMGSSVEEMTKEQREIYQSLVDEAYEQFVGIVADGRDMSVKDVKKIADGRVYTAKQAKDNGLVDEIGTFDEAVSDMKSTYNLSSCELEYFESPQSTSISSILGSLSSAAEKGDSSLATSLSAEAIEELAALNGKVQLSYICKIQK